MEFTYEQYVDDVLSGEQAACKYIKQACQRHRDDIKSGRSRGIEFDNTAAQMAIAFFATLRHSKGEWAGQPLVLEPWQQFHIGSLFGWKREDGTRRFRTSYLEIARKNGKSTLAAAVGLYGMVMDGEQGAEIFSAATKRDQARIVFDEAQRMVQQSPGLKRLVKVQRHNIHSVKTYSKFVPLGADADSLDGLNPHVCLIDEVHAHKTRDLYDVLLTAIGSRRQPIIYNITTAGFDRQSLCYNLHTYSEQVLSGIIEDDTFFPLIYTIDDEDDWQDESVWVKANPNLGVSKKIEAIRVEMKQAQAMPSALNKFLRLHMNVWTQAETRWIKREAWDMCGGVIDEAALAGRRCYAGLDLSTTTDITALVYVFPPTEQDAPYDVVCRFWIPEDNMRERSRRDRVPYDVWVRQGWIEATPGNVIDYAWILDQIERDRLAFDIGEIAFDRWGATKIMTDLMDMGGEDWLVQFGQGYASMAGPSKELEKLILSRELNHGDNPVLAWMADNVVVRQDPSGNVKPDKSKSTERIDGIVALIMSLDRAIRHGGPQISVYQQRGLRTL